MVSGIHTNVVSPENHRLCLQTDFLPAAQIKRKMTCICNPILIQICTSKMIRICSHLDTDLLSISEAFSSGHTKIVDFAHFYWFGRFLLISGCTRQNLLISATHGRGRFTLLSPKKKVGKAPNCYVRISPKGKNVKFLLVTLHVGTSPKFLVK